MIYGYLEQSPLKAVARTEKAVSGAIEIAGPHSEGRLPALRALPT